MWVFAATMQSTDYYTITATHSYVLKSNAYVNNMHIYSNGKWLILPYAGL